MRDEEPTGEKGNLRWPLGPGVRILNRDRSGLVALYKAAGILSHPNRATDERRSLLRARYDGRDECYLVGRAAETDGDGARVWLLNRLDSATSGVILCADSREVAEIVRRKFAEGNVKKRYLALLFGVMTPAKQVWRDRLRVSREAGRLRTSARGGLEAETEAVLKKSYGGPFPVSLVELRPKTGRTHQLRVQCGTRKLPIVGDQTYGNFAWNREFARATGRKRLFLHSAEVALRFQLDGRMVSFRASAPLPEGFKP